MCKQAGINGDVTKTTKKGGIVTETVYPKYEMIKSHTARRTFCTLCYERGMQLGNIRQFSGHKTDKSLMNYINITPRHATNDFNNAWRLT